MAESAEGARLLSECGGKLPPRVRIPLSPPFQILSPAPTAGLFLSRVAVRYGNVLRLYDKLVKSLL